MRNEIKIETHRLILREFRAGDLDALYALTCQREITDILPDWKMSREHIRNRWLPWIITQYDHFDPNNVRFILAMVHKDEGNLIGWIGVFPNDMLQTSDREIAYAISKDFRSRGYTTEAAKALTTYVFQMSNLEEIVAIVKTFNKSSRRVIEKSGFVHRQSDKLGNGHDYNCFYLRN
ncbi:MAG: GNAT family N-acetyltransferase [Proteobacteria bacterium]|nr:GNAT family N-acetyltransferase [Pseudomonadota bacterium]